MFVKELFCLICCLVKLLEHPIVLVFGVQLYLSLGVSTLLYSFRDFWLELPLLLSVTIAYPVLYTGSSALTVFWFSSFDLPSLLSVTIANPVLYTGSSAIIVFLFSSFERIR
ncbi:hypothetical protein ACB098_01G342400 [Castanea mollissima]